MRFPDSCSAVSWRGKDRKKERKKEREPSQGYFDFPLSSKLVLTIRSSPDSDVWICGRSGFCMPSNPTSALICLLQFCLGELALLHLRGYTDYTTRSPSLIPSFFTPHSPLLLLKALVSRPVSISPHSSKGKERFLDPPPLRFLTYLRRTCSCCKKRRSTKKGWIICRE